MFLLVSVITFISATDSAPTPDKNDTLYLQATVLFYKNSKGELFLANGTIPEVAALAVRDDISSRVQGALVKVVPIFNNSNKMPQTFNVLDYVKDEYKTIVVTELPENVSRKLGRDLIDIQQETGLLNGKNFRISRILTSNKNTLKPTEPECNSCEVDSESSSIEANNTNRVKDTNEVSDIEEVPESNEHTDSFENVPPNDIYYGIEKKCVNWADGCNMQSKNILELPSRYLSLNYKKPKFVKGPFKK